MRSTGAIEKHRLALMAQRHYRQSQRGFTLVELAVVIAIVAVVIGIGTSLGQDAINFSKRFATQEQLESVQEAIDGFVEINGYLPCPADRSLEPLDDDFGEQNCTSTNAPHLVEITNAGGNVLIGAVPIRLLQLPDSYASDSWGQKLLYAVSKNMAYDDALNRQTNTLYINNPGNIDIRGGDPFSTNYPLTEPSGRGAYVLLSHGESGAGAYRTREAAPGVPCNSTLADGVNCDNSDIRFYDNFFNDGDTNQFFDDFVKWSSRL